MANKENERLSQSSNNRNWKKWGPYLSERQWGTVREDYSRNGNAWDFVNHDLARSYTYRWGEEGIGGFCDSDQVLCLAPAFWNGRDPILKERLFGLANGEGNHGEDVKELYFHLDSSPTHSYCKFLYKYPQAAFPYGELVKQNKKDRSGPEYELLDTGVFKDDRYFDCYIEYAKEEMNDILMKVTVHNRGPEPAMIHVLPHLWFRNFWKHNPRFTKPVIVSDSTNSLLARSTRNGSFFLYHQGGEQLFCENETNNQRMYNRPNDSPFVKDGINNYVVNKENTVNPQKQGTKAAVWFREKIKPGASKVFRIRVCKSQLEDPWTDFEDIFSKRQADTNKYYDELAPKNLSAEHKQLLRSSVSGLLWTKQFYYLDVFKWHFGEPGETPPDRSYKRNYDWQHLTCRNIISMPD
ncbi:MAG TPA: glucosidase, partial [Puia sp.]|nr:glucosidase [Puia sp.]